MAEDDEPQDENTSETETDEESGDLEGDEALEAASEESDEGDSEEEDGEQAGAERVGPEDDDAVYEVPVELWAVLGNAQIPVAQLLKMGRGAVLELDRRVGDQVDILVNKRMVARGDVVVVEDRLGVTLSDALQAGFLKP